jgi:16S rRNA (cytosine1402-N4)-methyltransferase
VLGLDWDQESLDRLRAETKGEKRLTLAHANYRHAKQAAAAAGLEKVSGIILDLGFSSLQMDDPARGFSFQAQGPLDMRYDKSQSLTAEAVINDYDEKKLAEVFRKYGEENHSSKIAHEIVRQRKLSRISATDEVFHLIKEALPAPVKHKAADSARRVFQALRIEVNGELDNLQAALPDMLSLLEPHGRLVVISFHSLEDRMVKQFFLKEAKDCICPPDFPECVCGTNPNVRILTRKPVTASESEVSENPRSKPAKLRAAEKTNF